LKVVSRLGILGLAASFVLLFLCLLYVYFNPNYDVTTFVVGVAIPGMGGSAILFATRQRVLAFVYLAYFWGLVDDAPVHFDSVLTWPEVTRYQPYVPYLMDFVLLGLALLFFSLAVLESIGGKAITHHEGFILVLLTMLVFGLSYLQDLEISPVQYLVDGYWYQFDLVEHIVSGVALFLTLRYAERM